MVRNERHLHLRAAVYRAVKFFSFYLRRAVLRGRFTLQKLSGRRHLTASLEGKRLRFVTLGFRSFERALQSPLKEPETQQWISTMKPGEVFWDVGANIGTFSALAKVMGCRVVSLEPEPKNYENLVANLKANSGPHPAIALPVGLSNKAGFFAIPPHRGRLAGTSEALINNPVGSQLTSENGIGLTLDSKVVASLLPPAWQLPQHVKIDTDGDEVEILDGLGHLLAGPIVSAMVECSASSREKVEEIFSRHGLTLEKLNIDTTRSTTDLFFRRQTSV